MRIVLDARAVHGQSDGMSNYIRHLVVGLLTRDEAHEYVLLLNQTFADELRGLSLLGRPGVVPVVTSIPFMGLSQQFAIPGVLRRHAPADVYHYPHFDMPGWAHPRSVVTIYDLNHLRLPGYFDSQRQLKRVYSAAATRWSLAKARQIIAISHETKSQLLQSFPHLDPDRITVIYFGLNEHFRTKPDEAAVQRFRNKYGLGQDRFILYVGTDRPHKNLDRLLLAYAKLRVRSGVTQKLLLVGGARHDGLMQQRAAAAGLNGSVARLGYLPEDELPLAYQVADVLAFCSVSEGFGMPLLEAMASGVPIVTSKTGAMAEIAGESAVLVDPFSVDSIADGLFTMLTSQEARRSSIAQGRATVQRFNWRDAARQTLEVYRKAGQAG